MCSIEPIDKKYTDWKWRCKPRVLFPSRNHITLAERSSIDPNRLMIQLAFVREWQNEENLHIIMRRSSIDNIIDLSGNDD